jgi:hypothetical protein
MMSRLQRRAPLGAARRSLTGMVAGALAAVLVAGCGGTAADGDEASVPPPPDADEPFDPEASEELAEQWLGVAEDDIEETEMLRIARRGEEFLPATMDLRPGRFNVELDEDEDGVYRVTRIIIENDQGESIVVE